MSRKTEWPKEAKVLAKELHEKLSLNDKNWHSLKGNHERRSAEMLTSAMLQLLQGGDYADVEELLNQAKKWLSGELKDPGCPTRK